MTVERENSKVINNSRLGQLNENTNGADASGEMQLAEAIAIIARHSFDNTDAPPDAKKSFLHPLRLCYTNLGIVQEGNVVQ